MQEEVNRSAEECAIAASRTRLWHMRAHLIPAIQAALVGQTYICPFLFPGDVRHSGSVRPGNSEAYKHKCCK
jgi:hypothetical protein